MNHCLVRQDFDSEAFGLPFFRLARLDPELLGGEMRRIARLPGALADARLPAAARHTSPRIRKWSLGP